MSQAKHDDNFNPTIQGVSSVDLATPTNIAVDPVTLHLQTDASVSIAANSSVNVNQWGGTGTTLGQKAMTASVPVVLASDQASIPVAATLSAETTKVIGTVNVAASQSIAVTQATASSLNATVVGTGTFVTQATLAAETTKVIGVTRTADGSGNLLTSTSNALDVNLKTSAASNISVNVAQLAGTTTDTNSGSKSAGTLRVVLATDQPQLTNKLLVTPDANSAINLAQLAGNTASSGVGASGTGTFRVVEANDAGRTLVSKGGSAASNGNNTLVAAGTNKLKVFAFSLSTTSTTAMTCIFQSGASGTELWRVILQAGTSVSTGANLSITPPACLFATASATLLNLSLSSANTVHWSVSYFDEA